MSPPTGQPSGGQDSTNTERSLLEPYARFRTAPLAALQELGLHFLGEGWRSYDHIVGQDIFYPGFSEQMKTAVLQQPTLRAVIARLASERATVELTEGLTSPSTVESRRQELTSMLHDVAAEWTDSMICKMDSRLFIRSAYYLTTQLLTRAYHQGIHVDTAEVLRLRRVAETAASRNQSIIFLPCHRSHVDYVSLQLVTYRLGLALPTVIAGDNLNFPLIGPFLQHAGAMWIRRAFGQDRLYAALVQAYMDTLLQRGHNLECFVEGGRSRTGKLLPPKFGILRFLLESILSGRVADALVCPVSTQYDKVIEVDSYIRELLGQPKPQEGLRGFLGAADVLRLRLGRVDVRFREPWSLRAFVQAETAALALRGATDLAGEEALRRRLLQVLGYRVLEDINRVSVVMPTALVGTALLTVPGGSRGVGRAELVRRVDWLGDMVVARGGRVAHFAGRSTDAVVERALDVLGPQLVTRVVDGLAEPTFHAADRFQLSFYRNMTIHLFVQQALVCAALASHLGRHPSFFSSSSSSASSSASASNPHIPYPALATTVAFLSRLFRAEFIFPTTPFDTNLAATVADLEAQRVLVTTTTTTGNPSRILTLALPPATATATATDTFPFLTALLAPFIEAAWLAALALYLLVPPSSSPLPSQNPTLPLPTLISAAQLLGKTLHHQGFMEHFESVNKEALGNALARSEEGGVLVRVGGGEGGGGEEEGKKGGKEVRLGREWVPAIPSPSVEGGGGISGGGGGGGGGGGKLAAFVRQLGEARVDSCARVAAGQGEGEVVASGVWDLVVRVRGMVWGDGVGGRVGRGGGARSLL